MEHSNFSPPEEGWRKKSTKLIVVRDNKIYFLKDCFASRLWAIVGIANNYRLDGAISAARRTYNFFRADLTITLTDLSASSIKSILEPENTQSVRAEFDNKAYDLVDGEGIRLSVEKDKLVIRIHSFKRVLRKFVVRLGRKWKKS